MTTMFLHGGSLEVQFLLSNNRPIFINVPMIVLISIVSLPVAFSLSSVSLLNTVFRAANTPYPTCVLHDSRIWIEHHHHQGVAQNRLQIQGPLS